MPLSIFYEKTFLENLDESKLWGKCFRVSCFFMFNRNPYWPIKISQEFDMELMENFFLECCTFVKSYLNGNVFSNVQLGQINT